VKCPLKIKGKRCLKGGEKKNLNEAMLWINLWEIEGSRISNMSSFVQMER
jgi:hypothetical protein